MPDAAGGFSSSAVLPVLQQACARADLASDGAELLRLGENAIYQLACAPVVVRIARSADRPRRVERELCIARWLAAAQDPEPADLGDGVVGEFVAAHRAEGYAGLVSAQALAPLLGYLRGRGWWPSRSCRGRGPGSRRTGAFRRRESGPFRQRQVLWRHGPLRLRRSPSAQHGLAPGFSPGYQLAPSWQ